MLSQDFALQLLDDEGDCCEHLRAWVVQLLTEKGKVNGKVHQHLVAFAKKADSRVDRLYLAAALQRLPLEQRRPIAEALLAHADDADDHNLPLMIWYGIEPLVAKDKVKAAQLIAKTKIPLLRQYIARRMTGAAAFPRPKVRLGYKVKNAIEGEAMKILSLTGGKAASQKMTPFPKDKWSGVDHLWWINGKPGDILTLELNVAKAGNYEIHAVLTKALDYGIVQLSLDGTKLGKPIDGFHAKVVITTGVLKLAKHKLAAGKHKFTIEITGTNPKAIKRYMFGLDYVKLVLVK